MRSKPTSVADIDPRLLKAIGHPLRQRILSALNQRVASPSDLARDLDERLGNVSYHVKILVQCGAIELVRTEPVRGAVEHFYRATRRAELDSEGWAKVPLSIRREIYDDAVRDICDRIADATAGGGLDDARARVSSVPLELDEEGYRETAELLDRTLEQLRGIQARAVARASADGGESRLSERTEVALLHFHRPGDGKAANQGDLS